MLWQLTGGWNRLSSCPWTHHLQSPPQRLRRLLQHLKPVGIFQLCSRVVRLTHSYNNHKTYLSLPRHHLHFFVFGLLCWTPHTYYCDGYQRMAAYTPTSWTQDWWDCKPQAHQSCLRHWSRMCWILRPCRLSCP